MATPTRRAASRSAAPSSTRSTKASSKAGAPMSPLGQRGPDIPIDPSLLVEDDALQDDIDAEGEVDDGVGYYLPVSCVAPLSHLALPSTKEGNWVVIADAALYQDGGYYYAPVAVPVPFDAYAVPGEDLPLGADIPLLANQAGQSASSLSLDPARYSSAVPSSMGSPVSTLSTGTVKRKRGRPPKNPAAHANGNGNGPSSASTSTPRAPKANGSASSSSKPNGVANGARLAVVPETICSLCGGTDGKNKNGQKEKMVSCVRCGRSGHPSCLGHNNPAVIKKMMSYDWCCIECKPCEVCLVQGDDVSCWCWGTGMEAKLTRPSTNCYSATAVTVDGIATV